MALGGNLGLKQARQSIDQARGELEEARSGLRPKLNLTGTYNRMDPVPSLQLPALGPGGRITTQTIYLSPVDNFAGRLALSQLVSSFGKLEQTKAAAVLEVERTRQEYETRRQEVCRQARVGCYRLALAGGLVKVADDQVRLAEDQLAQTRVLLREGVVSRYDVLRMELALSRARQQAVSAANDEKQARQALLNLIGADLDRPLRLVGIDETPEFPVDREQARRNALARRPELWMTRTAIIMAGHRLAAARALDNPDLSVSTAYSNQTANPFTVPNQWTAMLLFSVPLNDGGLSAARAQQMAAAQEALRISLEDLERQVITQVDQAIWDMEEAAANLAAARHDVASAGEGLRMVRIKFREGMATALEVEDAMHSLEQAKSGSLSAICLYRTATAALRRAMGEEDGGPIDFGRKPPGPGEGISWQ